MSTHERILWHKREEALAGIQSELQQERANALGRVGEALDQEISRMLGIAATLLTASGDQRTVQLRAYNKAREAAKQLQWYLIVQREAIGMRDHTVVERLYPIPPPITR